MRQRRQVLQEELDALLQEKNRLETRAGIAYSALVRRPQGAKIEVHATELDDLKARQARVNAEVKVLRTQLRALEQQIRRDEGRLIRKGGAAR